MDVTKIKKEYDALSEKLTNPGLISDWGSSQLLDLSGHFSEPSVASVKKCPG